MTSLRRTDSAAPDLGAKHALEIARRTVRFDRRRVRARRLIVRELDEWFGIFHYPDPSITYAMAPSREAALDE
jgi:hypothetical protein